MYFSNLAKKTTMIALLGIGFSHTSFAKIEKFSPNWQIETDDNGFCHYTLTHIDHAKKLRLSAEATGTNYSDECSAVLDIYPYAVSSNLALIDAPTERGGMATIVRIKNNQIFTQFFHYTGTDEDSLDYKLNGNRLKLFTSTWKKTFILQNDGKIVTK